ncbi:fumarylacetoacetate hydrolase family protein [Desulfovibrio ferrophilus]|uniref:Ureidoglycolate lyase n=1 Tax=Desulfovibrio ferrophilus TaxID=241368 RepID=A0A2Z6AZL5_9BACT|nr:fumarylacetoacetate hydrolase family protein [Desulfovibrio ferrophilus]BBD08625.1 ureidoglycolate lyase [Desulfovibrio ferrophilus]
MRIIRVAYNNYSFYAQLLDGEVLCLDRSKGLDKPLSLSEVQVLPLAVPSKIVCLGLNYRSHAEELGHELPQEPLIFLKPPTSVIAHGQPILIPSMSEQVDYEGELAVIIGRQCKNVPADELAPYIFGYACANDVTARDLQRKDGLFTRAKGFDTFAPIGPWIETDVSNPGNLNIRTLVNGQVRQQGNTSEMVFSVPEAVSFISRVMTLMPGDVVLTGTPAGIGELKAGDEVTVEIETVGLLTNTVQNAPQPSAPVTEDPAATLQ